VNTSTAGTWLDANAWGISIVVPVPTGTTISLDGGRRYSAAFMLARQMGKTQLWLEENRRRWPCALASTLRTPPCLLEHAASSIATSSPRTTPTRPRAEVRFAACARQPVPARSRRKLRTWER
jgi:hypothetical protein